MRSPLSRPGLSFVLWSTLAVAACDAGQTDPPDDEPDIASMTIDIDGASFSTTTAGFEEQTLELTTAGFTINSATFRRPSGVDDERVTPEDFQLDVVGDVTGGPLPAGVSFTRDGPFSGSVSGIQAGRSLVVWLGLFHAEKGHYDFGPFPLTVNRAGGGGAL